MSHGGESGNDVEELSEDDEQIQLNHAEKIENEYERNLREVCSLVFLVQLSMSAARRKEAAA